MEGTENFFVNLSNPVNATIADAQGVATIVDDDTLILLEQTGSTRGVALDSVTFVAETLPIITERNFSSDHRTRLLVFAIGTKLGDGEQASQVTASAEDSTGTVRPLQLNPHAMFQTSRGSHKWWSNLRIRSFLATLS